MEQANHALTTNDEVITQQILQALASTSTDYIELNEKNITALTHNGGVEQPIVPNCNLSNALYHRNSSLFTNNGNLNHSNQSTRVHDGSWSEQPVANDASGSHNAFPANNAYNQQHNAYGNNNEMGASGDAGGPRQEFKHQNLENASFSTDSQPHSNDILSNSQFTNVKGDGTPQQDLTKIFRGFRRNTTQPAISNHEPNVDSLTISCIKT